MLNVSQTKLQRIIGTAFEVNYRVLQIVLLILAFMFSALAGHFYENTDLFWYFALPAIAVGALVGYISDSLTKFEIKKIQKGTDQKITELQKQFEEKLRELRLQLEELKADHEQDKK